ncbi:tRNA pseudouridine(38-40) synthase TruA [Campylobacter fetus]|uniref:tRNA pseudouridine(38-40) synthase TruA n=1 Tax=Campylobacter fetus TaxID=196 RepID=UPI0012712FD3|nr:tRNA pseudouridine(38-40) synthase TruA [Campylobacter fetus]EAI5646818.1 tRNA pseudouridine(38-40) synthase TruA [Campylobacter fetus]EAI5945372.1 tRNA pseudouridine(38-40) synthase TruA [Campylobacter fetus]EAJ0319442.1 tRNA pseudouridine(38-40) synthase TruA [Campylobacter fetus]EAJ0345386.1 tRNA pseudouridine(38-40) synthase TruA [Campylobacter fetus]EAJ1238329.1 tRNA pseudouridine(38-40) synthase TruA [Campylobacter fetus]
MMKIALTYSYNGSKFKGSQTQPDKNAVEDCLNFALNRVGIFKPVVSSSRTDKGVHAISQVSCVECGEFWNERFERLKNQINKHTKPYIYIKNIQKVSDEFHPRYDAVARSYRYIIYHDEQNVFLADYVHFYKTLNIQRLNIALKLFIGKHDFTPFYKVGSGEKSTVREIFYAKAYQIYKTKDAKFSAKFKTQKPNLTIINFKANGFLRAQVRLMVANALQACKSDENLYKFISNFKEQKPLTRMPSPPNGLYLKRVFY